MIVLEKEVKKARDGIVEVLKQCCDLHKDHDLLDKEVLRTKPLSVKHVYENESYKIQVKLSKKLDEQTTNFIQKRLSAYVALFVEITS